MLIINKNVFKDVKIYSSSERRVTATADVFAQSFLNLDKIPSDLIVVTKEMLDDSNAAKEQMETVKSELQAILDPNLPSTAPPDLLPKEIGNPTVFIDELINLLRSLRIAMRNNFETMDVNQMQSRWCCSESPYLFKVIFLFL